MALTYRVFYGTVRTLPRPILVELSQLLRTFCSGTVVNKTLLDADVFDTCTSQIVQKALDKIEVRKARQQSVMKSTPKATVDVTVFNIGNSSAEETKAVFQRAVDNFDHKAVAELFSQCIQHEKCLDLATLIQALSVCSQSGDKEAVLKAAKLCDLDTAIRNSGFEHFVAEAVWFNGDIPKSLEIFERVYRENSFLRRRVRFMLKYLIDTDLLSKRGEAALQRVISVSERLLKDFNDYFPLTCLWQACFISEWYNDHCIALELLERNYGLCDAVINRISYVVFISLRCHRTEVVYRLLEVLLKYNMKSQYANVLVTLLDYQFEMGDLSSCSEIIRWAVDNEVELPGNPQVKLINLILNHKMKTPFALLKHRPSDANKYSLKF